MTKPTLTDEHKTYLDGLRATGTTNMFGAAPYLVRAFPSLSLRDARSILTQWMKSFKG